MRHRKLTVVAYRLGLTQSAISHLVRRWRRPFDADPTKRALDIADRSSASWRRSVPGARRRPNARSSSPSASGLITSSRSCGLKLRRREAS
jgi:hypothetical protein